MDQHTCKHAQAAICNRSHKDVRLKQFSLFSMIQQRKKIPYTYSGERASKPQIFILGGEGGGGAGGSLCVYAQAKAFPATLLKICFLQQVGLTI